MLFGCTNNQTPTSYWSDKQSQINITKVLNQENKSSQTDLHSRVLNGNVLLFGHYPQNYSINNVIVKLKNLPNIKQVYNNSSQGRPLNFQQISEDNYLVLKINTSLLTDGFISNNTLNFAAYDSDVFVIGSVPQNKRKQIIGSIQKVSGINKIMTFFNKD